jgi:hypothetical protein
MCLYIYCFFAVDTTNLSSVSELFGRSVVSAVIKPIYMYISGVQRAGCLDIYFTVKLPAKELRHLPRKCRRAAPRTEKSDKPTQ